MMKSINCGFKAIGLCLLIATNAPIFAAEKQASASASPQFLAAGKVLYEVNCANCHGPHAQGAAKADIEISIITERGGKQPPDLTDAIWDHGSTDSDITTTIKKGIPLNMMPAYEESLSDVQIGSVVAYLRSLAMSSAPVPATTTAQAPQNFERMLELADYVDLPITGDMSPDRVSGVLARGSILRDEPGSERFFVNDLVGLLYIIDKKTKQLTPYLNFDGRGDRDGVFPKFTPAQGYAAGLLNFAFDPDYARNGIFYTLHMENPNTRAESAGPKMGAVPGLEVAGYTTTPVLPTPIIPDVAATRDFVVVEWTDRQIGNTTFEGTAIPSGRAH